jgi:hypothetical protein
MPLDERLRRHPRVIETGRRHGRLDILDRLLALRDAPLEVGDLGLEALEFLIAPPLMGAFAFPRVMVARAVFL